MNDTNTLDALARSMKRLEMHLPQLMSAKTLERWHSLPLLLDRPTMMEWTGLNAHDFDSEVASGRLRLVRKSPRPGVKLPHPMYHKHDLLQFFLGEHAIPDWIKTERVPVENPDSPAN
jgi:hypothetical protein